MNLVALSAQSLTSVAWCLAAFCGPSFAQTGSIDGIVINDATGRPLKRAQVLLQPDGPDKPAGAHALSQTTDDSGAFAFPKVLPGRYSATVQREGYLPASSGRIGTYRMPPIFRIESGVSLQGFTFRMKSWGLISGRVKFDDAEPASNVAIQLYREYFWQERHGYSVAASTRTDDRGEYRVSGLEPGAYYVTAVYQPPALPKGVEEEQRKSAQGLLPELSYAVTFYPSAQRLEEAVPVHIASGEEVSAIDIFLSEVPTVRIQGRVTSAVSGMAIPSPAISVRRGDADDTGSIVVPANVTFDRNNNFEIRHMTPGPYVLLVAGSDRDQALTARRSISVSEGGAINVEIVAGPPVIWKGKVRVEGGESIELSKLRVVLEPRHETARQTSASVSADGSFALAFVPQETYDLYVRNAPDNAYIQAVRVAGFDKLPDGLEVQSDDAPSTLDVVLNLKGGTVQGKALSNDVTVATGANIALIPDPPEGRAQAFNTTYADEYGNFLLQGTPPGRYLLMSWFDELPCDFFNPGASGACRSRGTPIRVDEGSFQNVQVNVK